MHVRTITRWAFVCIAISCCTNANAQVHPDDIGGRPIPPDAQEEINVRGVVRDAKGNVVADATVMIVMSEHSRSARPSGVQTVNWLPTAVTHQGLVKTNNAGEFETKAIRRKNGPCISIALVAHAKGHGMVWHPLDLCATDQTVSTQLKEERIVRGRVIDLKGQPAVGANVYFAFGVVKWKQRGSYFSTIPKSEGFAPWQPVKTDDQGRFILRGFSEEEVRFEISHPDLAAHQEKVKTFPITSKEKVTISVAPAHTLFGQVTYEDTGKPAANVAVMAPASDMGDWRWQLTRTDDEGRYHVNPFPPSNTDMGPGSPKGYYLNVFPPEDSPYIVAREIVPVSRAAQQEVNIVLKRGVVTTGLVKDDRGKPVEGARVQYSPHVTPKPGLRAYMTATPEPSQLQTAITKADGTYELATMPGQGRLLVLAPTLDFVPIEWHRGVYRSYADGYAEVETADDATTHRQDFTLRRGIALKGKVVDPDGKPISRFKLVSRNYRPSGYQPQTDKQCSNGEFTLLGCDPDKTHKVSLFDEENKLGATVELDSANATTPAQIRLSPLGTAKCRFVCKEGKPLKYQATLDIPLSEGAPHRLYITHGNEKPDWDVECNYRMIGHPMANEDGAMEIKDLIPGTEYLLRWMPHFSELTKTDPIPHVRFVAKSGETIDLGKLVAERRGPNR